MKSVSHLMQLNQSGNRCIRKGDRMLPLGKLYKYGPFLFMGKLMVPDGNGGIEGVYGPMKVAIDFFTHSNDALFAMYGFNWVPEEPYWSRARKKLGYCTLVEAGA